MTRRRNGPWAFRSSRRLVLLVVGVLLLLAIAAGSRPQPEATSSPPASAAGRPSPYQPAVAVPSPSQFAVASRSPTSIPTPSLEPTPPPLVSPSLQPPSQPATAVPARRLDGPLALRDLLANLEVTVEDRIGYDRSLFAAWLDADGDGCDTRREVLIDEAVTAPSIGPGCRLTGGRWVSLYDGVVTTNPGRFDIDHVVALAEAWDSGASRWPPDRRARFANDLGVDWALIAVSAASNRAKADLDPAAWLPPRAAAVCDYLAMWLAVKVRWSLSVDPIERAAIGRQIGGCPQRMDVAPAP